MPARARGWANAAVICLAAALAACRADPRPSLSLGARVPEFALTGVDGQIHTGRDYAASAVLAVVFTCNHCPASQLYERRIQKLYDDYRNKGVSVVAINPDHAAALRPVDLAHSDSGDSLDDMKARAGWRHLTYPYLYDGDTQTVAKAFGVLATPHIFVFDRDRRLRYEGRIDDDARESFAKTHEARDAIDALLAGQPVRVAHTRVSGCPPVWAGAAAQPEDTDPRGEVNVEMATADVLKKLRANGTDKFLVVNFWATWCGPCAVEFPDLVATGQMYRRRGVEFVSVSENDPGERLLVLEFLRKRDAFNRNLLFATPQTYEMQASFDPAMPAAVPFTLVIAPNGDVVYQELGSLDVLKLRRAILANLPDDKNLAGAGAYWGS